MASGARSDAAPRRPAHPPSAATRFPGSRPGANQLLSGSLTRGLLSLAGPMFASAMLQNAQSLIDLFWVGRLGSAAVAALAMSGTILMLLFPVVMGMSTGTVALVARAIGAGRDEEASHAASHSLFLGLVSGIVMGAVGWYCTPALCHLLGAEAQVADLAGQYLRVSFIGAFTVFVLFLGNSALQGAGNAVLPMLAMLLANVINIVVDPLLIFGWLGCPRMGVRGAAWATVASQAVAAGLVVFRLARGAGRIRLGNWWRFEPAVAWRILRIGIPGTGQMLSRSLMAVVLFHIVARCGTAAMAAYGIGLRFHSIILLPAFALGNAAATMVGQNLGAGQPGRARTAAWLATGMDMILMGASALVLAAFAAPFTRVFDSNPVVVATGAAYLRTVSPSYVFAALGIVLGRALNGAGDTVPTMIITVLSLWGLQVPVAVWFARSFAVPTQGIWWAIALAMTANGLRTAAWFQTGRWQRARV